MSGLTDLLHDFFEHRTFTMHISCPGIVEDFDWKTSMATVQPAIRLEFEDGRILEPPLIPGVPVQFPRGGGFSATWPIIKGDTGVLIFADRSIENWLLQGGVKDATDPRRFDINDAMFIPGINPFSVASKAENGDDVLFVFDGKKIRLKKGGPVQIESDVEIKGGLKVSKSVDVEKDVTAKGDVSAEGDMKADGEVTAGNIALTTHKHPDPQGGTVGAPIP